MALLDQIDIRILQIIQQDAKIAHKDIAQQLHLSRTPVSDRIRKMERAGVIKKYVALLNPKKIGKGLMVFCFISIAKHGKEHVNAFQKQISGFNQVMECFHIAGNFDFLLKVVVKDIDQYQGFVLGELSQIKNISNVQSSFVLGELKQELSFSLENIS